MFSPQMSATTSLFERTATFSDTPVFASGSDSKALSSVWLDFEDLTAFEPVYDQYQDLGVEFENAIALQPSNPAFQAPSNTLVLMPMTHKSYIMVQLHRSVSQVGATVVGARQVRLTAFDRHGNVLTQTYTSNERVGGERGDAIACFTQDELVVMGETISYVVFASEAPFILDNFFCC